MLTQLSNYISDNPTMGITLTFACAWIIFIAIPRSIRRISRVMRYRVIGALLAAATVGGSGGMTIHSFLDSKNKPVCDETAIAVQRSDNHQWTCIEEDKLH